MQKILSQVLTGDPVTFARAASTDVLVAVLATAEGHSEYHSAAGSELMERYGYVAGPVTA